MEIDKKTIDELAFILKYFRSGLENIIDAMKYGAAALAGYEVLNHSETPKVTENKSENSSKIEQKLNQMISIESLYCLTISCLGQILLNMRPFLMR